MAADPDFIFMPTTRRSRKSNFSEEEIDTLVSNVIEHQDILLDKNKQSWELKDHQQAIWQYILQEVNKVAVEKRTMQEIRNKWKKYHSVLKSNESVNLTETDDYDSMPLQQRLSHSSTTSNEGQQVTTCQESSLLQSQTITPTKIKVTRQGIKSVPTPPPPPVVEPPNEEVCLRWNSHHTNMQAAFPNILLKEKYVDTTLVSEGRQKLKCHRMILSACSQYFEDVLSDIGPLQHPVLCMKDIPYWILKALCDFMYAGEVHIRQNKLEELLKVAEALQIKGLAGKPDAKEELKPIKQEIKEPIKQELKEPIVKLVKEPLLPFYSHLLKPRDLAPTKEKTPVKETMPLRQKSQPILTRSGGQKDAAPAQNVRQKDSGWREIPTHATRQKELPGLSIRHRETRILEREDTTMKKPGPKSKTQPQKEERLPQKVAPPSKVVPQPKVPPAKPSTSKATFKSNRSDRARSHSYTEKQKELKIPLTKGNINDPLDLLEPVYEEIQKQPAQQPLKILAKIPISVSPKKSVGSSKKLKKRRHAEEEPEEVESLSFQSRKGTRSRPNVKVPRFYDPSFDQPDATIVREPHTDQNESLHSSAGADQNTPCDPFQSIEMEEIKVEPAELEESNLIDARGNIVSYMGHQEQEGEEIMGSYDSPIVNIKKEAATTSTGFKNIDSTSDQSVQMNVTTVTEGRTSTSIKMIGINKDRLKVVDISKIQRGKSNVDQLVHTPVNNPGFRISNVQTVPEESSSNQPPPPEPSVSSPPSIPEPIVTLTPIVSQPSPILAVPEPQPSSTTHHKSKRSEKKIVPNPVAIRIKEERMDPDYLPSQSDLPPENQIFIKTEIQDQNESISDESRTTNEPSRDPDQILDIIGVSKSIKKEILDHEDISGQDTSKKQDKLKEFRKIKLTDPKHELQRALSKRMAEMREKQKTSQKISSTESTESNSTPGRNLNTTCQRFETKLEESNKSPNLSQDIVSEIKLEPPEQSDSLLEAPEHPTSSQDCSQNESITTHPMETSEHQNSSQIDVSSQPSDHPTPLLTSENEPVATQDIRNVDKTENQSNNTQEMVSLESTPNIEDPQETNVEKSRELVPNLDDSADLASLGNNTQEMVSLENEIGSENQENASQEIESLVNTNLNSLESTEHMSLGSELVADNMNPTEFEESSLQRDISTLERNNVESTLGTEVMQPLPPDTSQLDTDEAPIVKSNTQEMLSIGSSQNLGEKQPNFEEPYTEEEPRNLNTADRYQTYRDSYSNEMYSLEDRGNGTVPNRQEIDFTQDDFGQDDFKQQNNSCQERYSYEECGSTQEMPESDLNNSNYSMPQSTNENGSSEINSAIANIPGNYPDENYATQNNSQDVPLQLYDGFGSTYETENENQTVSDSKDNYSSGQQETQLAVNSLQQENYNENEYRAQMVEDMNFQGHQLNLPPPKEDSNPMDEDFILEGTDEVRRIDEALDESLLEDFEEDVEMTDRTESEVRGPSPEKTLEMIVNDLNESLGDVRQTGTDNPS